MATKKKTQKSSKGKNSLTRKQQDAPVIIGGGSVHVFVKDTATLCPDHSTIEGYRCYKLNGPNIRSISVHDGQTPGTKPGPPIKDYRKFFVQFDV